MRGVLSLLIVLSVTLADAGSFTVLTTPAEDAALAFQLQVVNANRDAQGLPTVTVDQLVGFLLRSDLSTYVTQLKALKQQSACQVWTTLTPGQQSTITTQLGGNPPC